MLKLNASTYGHSYIYLFCCCCCFVFRFAKVSVAHRVKWIFYSILIVFRSKLISFRVIYLITRKSKQISNFMVSIFFSFSEFRFAKLFSHRAFAIDCNFCYTLLMFYINVPNCIPCFRIIFATIFSLFHISPLRECCAWTTINLHRIYSIHNPSQNGNERERSEKICRANKRINLH